ncbi:cyd operon protein YbgE [Vibrio sp. 10N.286.49.B3]|uniref:cyd operon protein YbgE n=1 Tax=Vibrio sp. 10N.286.49.B3 TaxID=1880855 RepID=UPI000C85E955|nr:cyd operon protein YbgE [Vibrio sp. 10N.286.49.B3]PMH46196.1 cyd operon protein YbgE [Vibrio sp. 10N.286.49.B3]
MSNMTEQVTRWHTPMDNAVLRAVALLLGFMHVGLVMWDPEVYATSIGGFNIIIGPLFIWALCSSMVYGIGFKPINWYWQLLFSPYFLLPILLYLTIIRLI